MKSSFPLWGGCSLYLKQGLLVNKPDSKVVFKTFLLYRKEIVQKFHALKTASEKVSG